MRLAIDDFGTGYSSLGYLKRFPVDISRSTGRSSPACAGTRGRGHRARRQRPGPRARACKVVAEGVETREQLAELRGLGCDQGQGYLFGRPTPTEVADVVLRRAVGEAVPA